MISIRGCLCPTASLMIWTCGWLVAAGASLMISIRDGGAAFGPSEGGAASDALDALVEIGADRRTGTGAACRRESTLL